MPLAAFYLDSLVVVDVETFLLEGVVIAGCAAGSLDICYQSVEGCVLCDDRRCCKLLAVLLLVASPATELLTVGYGYLLGCTIQELLYFCILLHSLCAENSLAVYIIIGKGEVWLETYGEFVGSLVAVCLYHEGSHGLLLSTFACCSISNALDVSVVCCDFCQRIGFRDEVCLL